MQYEQPGLCLFGLLRDMRYVGLRQKESMHLHEGSSFLFRQVQRGGETPFNVPMLWFKDTREGLGFWFLSQQDLHPSLRRLRTLGDPSRRSWSEFQPLH